MKHVYSDVITFTGNHYDFGYMQGELLKSSPILANRQNQSASRRKHHFTIDEEKSVELLTTLIPGMIDELRGLADALQMNSTEALREFGGYYMEYTRSGCSILTGSSYMIRNYDSHPAGYEGRYLLYQPTDAGYATMGPSGQITGRLDGMNEKGLAVGFNFINRLGSADGFICAMITRILLETCANVEEAVTLIKEIPHRTSFSYVLLDSSGISYVVEASPRSVAVRKNHISTNHFEMLTEENRYHMADSLRRQQLLGNQAREATVVNSYRLLNDTDKEVFSNKYGAASGTLHTAVYLPEERKAWFAIGGDRNPVIFDFNRFLQGEKINIKQIKGTIEYEQGFLNQEIFGG
ncbi:C45 family autoproteolytic acyltransferase/hydolase [Oceanobacillus halophilus]|uniref:Acyl-CoA--6-aminopenicillanic acid acyltransferase n=1 Tax=Oceanobacillus halophilus TaxID=930130 RepID=A0A495A3G4_9BACI|nr:C45 family peptidase [Oceanobacillus halophilus]RKQ34024.1 acyl-CoA--6-aminopenicillanic acid acyltransferase [Oceanobacillus halophilus]